MKTEELKPGECVMLEPGMVFGVNPIEVRLKNYIAHLRYRDSIGDYSLDPTGILSDVASELEALLRKESK